MAARRAGSKDLRRRTASRPERKTILIFCEGEASEPDYLNALKRLPEIRSNTAISLVIDPSPGLPLDLVQKAVQRRRRDRRVLVRLRRRVATTSSALGPGTADRCSRRSPRRDIEPVLRAVADSAFPGPGGVPAHPWRGDDQPSTRRSVRQTNRRCEVHAAPARCLRSSHTTRQSAPRQRHPVSGQQSIVDHA